MAATSPSGTSPPNLTFTTKWLCIDITIPATDVNHTSKDILLGFHNFTTASWLIDPFLSILPVVQTPNFLPLTQESDKFKSVQNLKHYLKNSNIATLLKKKHQDFFTLRACVQVHSSISATSLISELRSTHPDWIIIVDPYNGILPTPCGWLLFSSSHIQRVALASQLQSIFRNSSNIDTPLQCICANIQGIGDYHRSTAPAIQIKCRPTHTQAIQTLFLELIPPTATDNNDPRYIFQLQMVFMTPDMLSITDSAYASLLLDQNKFQASHATLKVPDICPLNTAITGSTDTLGIALTNLPEPTACNYLFCSIEPPLTPENSFIYLYYNQQYSSYTSSLITSLFSTLALLYPEIQKTEVWQTSSQHTCTATISELLTCSNTQL